MNRFSDKTNGLINFMDLHSAKYKLLYGVMFLLLILLSLACLLPVLWVFLSAFKTPEEMYSVPATLLPESFDFGIIAEIWGKVNFVKYFGNTMYLIIGCLVFDVVLNGLAGYVLSRVRPIGSALLETVIFGTMLLPGISMVPLYMTFVDMPIIHVNLTSSFLPMFLMAGCNAFNIMLFRNFFNGIPMDYLEAARIDGCTTVGIFFKIILPLSKPIVMVVTIFSVIGSWSNFMWPYIILGSSNKETISILLYKISSGAMSLLDNEVMLVLMLAIIPPMIFYMFFSKQIMGGLDMSGIKG